MEYRPRDPKQDWEFFDPDWAVPIAYLAQIRPLTAECAVGLWREYISATARHPMKLPDDAWPSRLYSSSTRADWETDWNDDAATAFADWLGVNLPWSLEAPVIFTHSSSQSVETSWGVFIHCWRNFLLANDEGPFLWSLQHPEAIGFSPRGLAYLGFRLPSPTIGGEPF